MNEKATKYVSKLLSFVLRHSPETIGIRLDENGWTDVTELIAKCNQHGHAIDLELLEHVVLTNDKKRFAFNDNKGKIRANQGHSVSVELNLEESYPPEYLYHGTVEKFMDEINKIGLQKMSRQHVHLSADRETAFKVGSRRGKPVILIIKSGEMVNKGFKFYLSANHVWLTETVPTQYIEF